MKTRKTRFDLGKAQEIGIDALSFLAGNPERLGRFLALTGTGAAELSFALDDPSILAAVLEHVIGDEPMLLEFASNAQMTPDDVVLAWDLLTLETARRIRS